MKTIPIADKISLRQLIADDAPAIFEAIDTQRPYLGRWLPFVEHTLRVEDTQQVVAGMMAADPYEYIFTLRTAECFAGLIGFKDTNRITLTTEIGYWMRQEYQGAGMMTRAVRSLCRLAFTELGMEQIVIRCATGNEPSNRIPQRLGFALHTIEPQAELLTGGELIDLNVYVLQRSDWAIPL